METAERPSTSVASSLLLFSFGEKKKQRKAPRRAGGMLSLGAPLLALVETGGQRKAGWKARCCKIQEYKEIKMLST